MLDFIKVRINLILKGMAIGVANIIPGVSGGTVAVILGVYPTLIESISKFFTNKEKRKDYFVFLLQIGIGAIVGIGIFAKIIEFSMANYFQITMFLFIGLILGGVPVVYNSHKDMSISIARIASFLVAFLVMIGFFLIDKGESASIQYFGMWVYFLSGMVAAGAMIIPGISGSLLLVLIGTYPSIVASVGNINITVLAPVAVGVIVGVLIFAKIIDILLQRAPAVTYYAILGLIVGSFFKLWPGITLDVMGGVGIAVLAISLMVTLKFNKIEK